LNLNRLQSRRSSGNSISASAGHGSGGVPSQLNAIHSSRVYGMPNSTNNFLSSSISVVPAWIAHGRDFTDASLRFGLRYFFRPVILPYCRSPRPVRAGDCGRQIRNDRGGYAKAGRTTRQYSTRDADQSFFGGGFTGLAPTIPNPCPDFGASCHRGFSDISLVYFSRAVSLLAVGSLSARVVDELCFSVLDRDF
jgi:hypothetical protein